MTVPAWPERGDRDYVEKMADVIAGIQSGTAPIPLAGISGALGAYEPLVNMRAVELYAADFGVLADGDHDNTENFEYLRDAIPATGAVVSFEPGQILLLDEVDFSSRPNVRFQGASPTSFNESAATPYGTSLIAGTAGMTMLRFGNDAALRHQGPKFERMNFRNGAGGEATLVHLENVNRWGFRDCTWRGYNTSGHADTGLVIYSNDTTSGGALAGGDCSWGVLDNCTMSGLYGYGIKSLFSYGFVVLGGEYTIPAEAIAMYMRGYHLRVLGAKIDGGLVDIVSEASFYEIHYESTRTPGVRVGNDYTLPNGTRNNMGNIIVGAVVGKNPTPSVGIELGQYAESTVLDVYVSNYATPVSEHSSSRGTCIRRPGATIKTSRHVSNGYAEEVSNSNTTNGNGLAVSVAGGDANTKGFSVITRSGTPIPALNILGDGRAVFGRGVYSELVSSKSGDYTANVYDHTLIFTNSSTATLTLPAVSGNTGVEYVIKRTGTGDVVVDGYGSEAIDGATTKTITTQYGFLRIKCTGSAWIIIASGGTIT